MYCIDLHQTIPEAWCLTLRLQWEKNHSCLVRKNPCLVKLQTLLFPLWNLKKNTPYLTIRHYRAREYFCICVQHPVTFKHSLPHTMSGKERLFSNQIYKHFSPLKSLFLLLTDLSAKAGACHLSSILCLKKNCLSLQQVVWRSGNNAGKWSLKASTQTPSW